MKTVHCHLTIIMSLAILIGSIESKSINAKNMEIVKDLKPDGLEAKPWQPLQEGTSVSEDTKGEATPWGRVVTQPAEYEGPGATPWEAENGDKSGKQLFPSSEVGANLTSVGV